MATAQQGTNPTGRPGAAPNRGRRVRLLVVVSAVIMPLLVLAMVLFGGPIIGQLTMNDLSGHAYTVTAIRVDGVALDVPANPPTISFRNEWVRWTPDCNEASSKYQITWSTLETSGAQVSTAMGCGDVTQAEGALARVMSSGPQVHLDDQRLLLSSPTDSIELLEST